MLGMIWAQGHGRAIGRDGTMPWHVPEDLRFFKRMTNGHPVIMGRRTWQSLGEKYRPLPGRANIVISRNSRFEAPGAAVVSSVDEAIKLGLLEGALASEASGSEGVGNVGGITAPSSGPAVSRASRETSPADPTLWIMGGAQIYAQALPFADIAIVTHVDKDVPGADAFAPEIPPEWIIAAADRLQGWNTSVTGTRYRFIVYTRPDFVLPSSLILGNGHA